MTLPAAFPLIGGRYQLVAPLGAPGGQGEVYTALDTHEGDVVAIKLLKSMPPGGVWHEARILRRLADNHVLPIRNADQDSGQPYLVTEIAAGGSLETLLAQTGSCGLDVDLVVRLIRHACMGVARAHDLGLLHNDLKPGNLFLNAEGECLVGDLGFASLLAPGQNCCRAPGVTPKTVAPEIAADAGGPHASVRSDIFSLGATAYWLIAAQPPLDFSGAVSFDDLLAIAASRRPPRLWDVAPHTPRSVQAAIEMAMDRDPARRYANVVDFARALGSRPERGRSWRRTDEHPAHRGCWRGKPAGGGSTVVLCVEDSPRPGRVEVLARHAASNNALLRTRREGPARACGAMVRMVCV